MEDQNKTTQQLIAELERLRGQLAGNKRAEAENLGLQARLLQSQKLESIGRMTGAIAHGFNNLLTVILGTCNMCLKAAEKDNPLRQDLEDIRATAERAAALTRQLLAFSRRQTFRPQAVSLNGLVKGMRAMFERAIGLDIRLVLRLAPDLGAVEADPSQLEQALLNLVINARDAMPGGGQITVETANVDLAGAESGSLFEVKPGPHAALTVSDTGNGMPEHVRSRIFEPFFTTKEPGKGTGLGLSTVYEIVQQCGGGLCVSSEPGRGSTFQLYFPLSKSPAPKPPPANAPAEEFHSGTETILLVEDEEPVRKVTARILRKCGYNVIEAANGPEALSCCERSAAEIHLVLTDTAMPGMGGAELARRLQAKLPAAKVVFMSGYSEESFAWERDFAGAHFVAKPFTADELAGKLREVLGR